MKKRLVAFLLVLIMVLGMLPVSALAADGTIVYDGVTLYTNTKPRYFTFLRNNAEGNVTKDVGESGVYQQRLFPQLPLSFRCLPLYNFQVYLFLKQLLLQR